MIALPFRLPWRALALCVLFAAMAVMLMRLDADRDKWRTAAEDERAAHIETKRRVAAAAQGAADLAEANRAAVEATWHAQYQEAQDANADLRERNRALLAQWMQSQGDRTDPGRPGDAGLPGAADLPAGPVHDAGASELSSAIVPVADLVRTADAYAQLEALIGFVTAASTVPTSPESD